MNHISFDMCLDLAGLLRTSRLPRPFTMTKLLHGGVCRRRDDKVLSACFDKSPGEGKCLKSAPGSNIGIWF
jgi:hypothetical protein